MSERHRSGTRRSCSGVCGGIAAYKAVEVCRRLVDAGVHVVPVLTEEATRFVGAVTFSALASEPVQQSLWDEAGADPAHPARPAGRPDPRGPGHGHAARPLRRRDLRRPAHGHPAWPPGPR